MDEFCMNSGIVPSSRVIYAALYRRTDDCFDAGGEIFPLER